MACFFLLLLGLLSIVKDTSSVVSAHPITGTSTTGSSINDFDDFNWSFDHNVTEYYFDTVVDHFNFRPTSDATFPLRYFVNDQYYANRSSPVLFYAGNEGSIVQFMNNSGFLFEAAKELQGMVVFAEHRYYGKSFPFGGSPEIALTLQNISYLTVEQAMADFNTLSVHIRHKWNMGRDAAFIVAGGSYGGNLALWLRLKNPNLWAGALASSATPLKHLLRESNAFSKIVADVYGNVTKICPTLIRNGWKDLFHYMKEKSDDNDNDGGKMVQKELNLCHIPSSNNDANEIYGFLLGALETMVQYGYPYPTKFYNPVPAYPFKVACENMVREKTPLASLRAAAQVYYNYTGQAGSCFDWLSSSSSSSSFTANGQQQQNFATSDALVLNRRTKQKHGLLLSNDNWDEVAWNYQCCTEVYQPMPTNGITDIELPYQPNKTEYFTTCQNRWEVTPRPNWEEMTFMSNNIQAGSNIFLTSGQLDPWRAAGIQSLPQHSSTPDSIIVRIIDNGAHHLDLRSSHPLDPPSVKKVRQEELESFMRWIQQWQELYPSTLSLSSSPISSKPINIDKSSLFVRRSTTVTSSEFA